MTVTVFIQDCGDGSARARFFKAEASAEKVAGQDGERFCDDVYETELPLNPAEVVWDDDGELV